MAIEKFKIYKNGELIAVTTKLQGCRMLCISTELFSSHAKTGEIYNGKYKIEAENYKNDGESEKRKILEEYDWDRIRFRLNPKAKGWEEYEQQNKLENHRNSADAIPKKEERI